MEHLTGAATVEAVAAPTPVRGRLLRRRRLLRGLDRVEVQQPIGQAAAGGDGGDFIPLSDRTARVLRGRAGAGGLATARSRPNLRSHPE